MKIYFFLTKKPNHKIYYSNGDTMIKKILIMTIFIILIPCILTNIITKKPDKIKLNYVQNKMVKIKREKTGQIEQMTLENYIIGVLAGEMPVSYQIEALKAQAVAARSYAMKKINNNKSTEYDLVDSVNNQVYISESELKELWKEKYEEKIKKIKIAVKATEGEYVTYNDEIIEAFFFSTSSGTTENCADVFGSNLPYLVAVSSVWDRNSPQYEETKTYTIKEIYSLLGEAPQDTINIEVLEQNETSSIKKIKINDKVYKGTDIRKLLKLKSTNMKIETNQQEVIFITKGYGHGVGMSQYGAEAMAKEGYNYMDILKHYYTGTEIKKI